MSKRVVSRSQAQRDLEDAAKYDVDTAANNAALGLVDAVEAAYAEISRHPSGGPQRNGPALNLPELLDSCPSQGQAFTDFFPRCGNTINKSGRQKASHLSV